MSKVKFKNIALAIVAALCFMYLAIYPYILCILDIIIYRYPISLIIDSIFDFSNATNFIACAIIMVGIFTKFDKIAFTASAGFFLLSIFESAVSYFISSIQNSWHYDDFLYIVSDLLYILAFFLMFAVGVLFTIFFFMKKELNKILKLAVFLPIIIWAIATFIALIPFVIYILEDISYSGIYLRWIIRFVLFRGPYLLSLLAQLVGFTAVAFKLISSEKVKTSTEVVL